MKDRFLTVDDVCKILKRKPTYCYKVIRDLNAELKNDGYYINEGRIPAKYFLKRLNLDEESFE